VSKRQSERGPRELAKGSGPRRAAHASPMSLWCTHSSPSRAAAAGRASSSSRTSASVSASPHAGAGGAPRADVLVQVSTVPARGALPRTWRLRTDEQGRYRTAERLPAGTYKVAAFADGFDARNQLERFLRLQRVERLVTVPPERRAVEQDLELR